MMAKRAPGDAMTLSITKQPVDRTQQDELISAVSPFGGDGRSVTTKHPGRVLI